ncbi:MAG: CotH kinase family protein [Clostridia bacterium]|nr:CotH kinase family protein [Clostridia bacterium]
MKKLLSAALALLLLLSVLSPVVAEDAAGIGAFAVNPYGGAEDAMDTVSWYSTSGQYYLFLPADLDMDAAIVYFTASDGVTLDGAPITSGGAAAGLTAGAHTLNCGAKTYTLNVMFSANLPAVYITTESGSLSYIHANKENKEPGKIRVYENGVKTLDKDLKQIKGRGNATWGYPKKPYNIKFDKKTDLFGMGKAKKWTLLANYRDLPLIHNAYGWEFAKAFGMTYTSEYTYVDLYINGDYKGNYVICESVEIGENRVDIADLEKANENANPDVDDFDSLPRGGTGANNTVQSSSAKGSRKWVEIPNDPADVTGGYLMEYEYGGRYDPELSGFVTKNGQPIVIKSPEQASRAEVTYIADFMDAGTEALYSATGYNAEGKHYSEYFDVDSLAAAYLTQEISMNFDAALSSFFAYKPEGENSKVVFGPVWDMDNAFGSRQTNMNVPLITTNLWWANQLAYHGIPTVLAAANRHADFRALVREKWAQCVANGKFDAVNSKIAAIAATLKESAAMNGVRWNLFSTADGAVAAAKWEQNRDISMGFVRDRTAELNKGLGVNGAYLYYDVNGANSGSWATVSVISEIGDSVTVRNITGNGTVNAPSGKKFYCWNTAADESGTAYFPGDTLTLAGECTVLYAVWKTQAEIDAIEAAAQLAADKAAFETAKADAVAAADRRALPDDSDASRQLIENAKASIAALSYDETKTLEENLAAIEDILGALDPALQAQREAEAAEETGDDNGGGASLGSLWDFLKQLLRRIADFFRRVFRIG